MGQFTETTTVNASPGDAFALIIDQDRVAEWNDHVQRVEVDRGGRVEVGTVLRQHRKRNNKDFVLEFTVTEHEPPHRHVVEGAVFGVSTTMAFLVEPAAGNRAKITMQATVKGRWLSRLLAPVVTKEMRKSTQSALQDLRRLLD